MSRPPRIGIGGPVGSGKTMLCLKLCQRLRGCYSMAVVTNDIYCSEDAQFLIQHSALRRGGWRIKLVAPNRIALRQGLRDVRRILTGYFHGMGCDARKL